MKIKNTLTMGLGILFLASCAQTNSVDSVTTSSIDLASGTSGIASATANPSPITPSVAQKLGSKVTELGDGKARIVVTTLNSVNIRDKHACELGKFAQSRNATNVLTPLQTEVKTDIEGAQTYRVVDQEFQYFSADAVAPDGSSSTASLLERCTI